MTVQQPRTSYDRRVLSPHEARELREHLRNYVAAHARYVEQRAGLDGGLRSMDECVRTMGIAEATLADWVHRHTALE